MAGTGKTKERDTDAKLASGSQTHLANVGTIKVDGKDYTLPQIVQRIDERVALLDKATTARADLKTAVTAEKLDRPVFTQFASSLRSIVVGMFRNDPKTLSDFDLAPRKTGKATVETKATATLKMRATRAARHTMGRRQKKGIKGTVPVVVPPVSVPPVAASPAVPAPQGHPDQGTSGSPVPKPVSPAPSATEPVSPAAATPAAPPVAPHAAAPQEQAPAPAATPSVAVQTSAAANTGNGAPAAGSGTTAHS